MFPTYKNGQIVSTEAYASPDDLRINDIIIARVRAEDGKMLIKRVVALSGDILQIVNGSIYRNGILIQEEFPPMEEGGIATEPYLVPENSFFLLGDNRNESKDSRAFGAVAYGEIAGKVTGRLTETIWNRLIGDCKDN